MRYPHVLICESNESDREVFSETLSDCYVDHCAHLTEIDALIKDGDYDAIFFGRSSIVEFLDGENSAFEKLPDDLASDGLFMFRIGDDHRIQVKKMSVLA